MNEFIEYLVHDLLAAMPNVAARAMFGGHGIYKSGRIFAIVIDQKFYLKADDTLAKIYTAAGAFPFTYERGPGVASRENRRKNMAMPDSPASNSFAAQPDEALAKTGKTYSMKYFCVPESILKNRETLLEWARWSIALPTAKAKNVTNKKPHKTKKA